MASISRRGFMGLAGMAGVSALLGHAVRAQAAERCDYDVVVVGAGVVGCCCARELARYDLSVLVVEAGLDIAEGATRANSGIVHAGFDPRPGTLKARYNVAGAAAYPRWQEELGFTYARNGALVLAFTDEERAVLDTLAGQAEGNGAEPVRVVDAEELCSLEPAAPAEALAALYAPASAIVDPYGVAFAAAENAVDNGVEFLFGRPVTQVRQAADGFEVAMEVLPDVFGEGDGGPAEGREGEAAVPASQEVSCRCVLNAAGVHADEINNMLSAYKLAIQPKRGEYLLYQGRSPFTCTMFQAPTAAGKGVLVGGTVFGNAFVGPNSVPQDSKDDVSTTAEGLADILEKARRTWPDAGAEGVISAFAGLRASNAEGGDFVVGQAQDVPGLFNAACIDSPGLASAPAIAEDLARDVARYLGADERAGFDPVRRAEPLFAFADDETKARLLERDPAYGVVVCPCYGVTQAEVAAALHGKLPVYTLDAIKWRTGATMGPCQGDLCLAKAVRLVMDELGVEVGDIDKRAAGSRLGVGTLLPEAAAGVDAAFDDGVYELPRAGYLIAGQRPAGVYGARGLLELMACDGLLPGRDVLVWGDTDYARRCEEALQAAGVQVTRLAGDARVVEVMGGARVEGVRVEQGGSECAIPCDALVVARDLARLG